MSESAWCGSQSNLTINSGRWIPSMCLCFTVQACVCMLYCCTFPYTIIRSSKLLLVTHIGKYDKIINRIVMYASIMQCILVAVFSIVGQVETSFGIIFSIAIQSMSWLVCAYNLHKDAQYLAFWPAWYTKLFIVIETMLVSLITFFNLAIDGSILNLFFGILLSLINFILLAMIVLKDVCKRSQSALSVKFEIDSSTRASVDERRAASINEQHSFSWISVTINRLLGGGTSLGRSQQVSSRDFTCIEGDYDENDEYEGNDCDATNYLRRKIHQASADCRKRESGVSIDSSKDSRWSHLSGWSFHSAQMIWGEDGSPDDLGLDLGDDDDSGSHIRPLLYNRPDTSSSNKSALGSVSSKKHSVDDRTRALPIVKSALEQNSDGGYVSNSSSRTASTAKSFGSVGKNSYFSDPAAQLLSVSDFDTEEGPRSQSLVYNDVEPSGKTTGGKLSSALQRALDQQKSRLIASSPAGLIPRGKQGVVGGGVGGSAASTNGVNGSSSTDINFNLNIKSGESQQEFFVTVQRWGIRRGGIASNGFGSGIGGSLSNILSASAGMSHQHGNDMDLESAAAMGSMGTFAKDPSNSKVPVLDSEDQITERFSILKANNDGANFQFDVSEDSVDISNNLSQLNRSVLCTTNQSESGAIDYSKGSNDSTNSPSKSTSSNPHFSHVTTDIEFEIYVRSGAKQMSSEQEWWGGSGGGDKDDSRKLSSAASGIGGTRTSWAVWRTAAELMSLHASLVSSFGDLAPRRPKLKSADVQGFLVAQPEIVSDMRAITAFLNALLRGSAYSQSSALRGFLKQSDKTSGASLFVAENDNGSQDYQGSIGDHGGLMSASAATSIHPYGAFGSAVSAMNSPRSNGIGAESVGDLIFQSHHQHNQHQTNNSATGSILSVGGDSLVAMEAKGLAINQQFKWRKLYTNLRVKLKPHEIGVRCRLFEGVISGAEITTMLIRTGSATERFYQLARDRAEACAIGQELVNCGLLVPVCCGFEGDSDVNDDQIDAVDGTDSADGGSGHGQEPNSAAIQSETLGTISNTHVSSVGHLTGFEGGSVDSLRFLDLPGYIYRFLERSNTAGAVGSCTIFGSFVKVSIPQWSHMDGDENMNVIDGPKEATNSSGNAGNRATMSYPVDSSGAVKGGHIEYLIDISHAGDNWFIWKRFREFEQLQRSLAKEGIRADIPLPSKTYGNFGGLMSKQTMLENRRLGLEMHLRSTLEVVVQSQNDSAIRTAAEFLDENFQKLCLA